jgi:hypothetical protein
MQDFIVVRDHPSIIQYIDGLQRQNAEALSFYPRVVFERERERGRLFLGLLNNQPCGYIWAGALGRKVPCHQVCIQYDARRRLYGAQIVAVMEGYAKNAASITLRCGFDLEANDFWKSLGYGVIAIQDGGVRRMRKINVWRKQLVAELFEPIHLEPARGEQDASLWTRHKQTGNITQFVRGKSLKDYRARLIALGESAHKPLEGK